MKYIILIFFSIFIAQFSFAQNEKQTAVGLIGRSYNDHIVLRLFPKSYTALTIANTSGYIIEKASFIKGTALDKLKFTTLNKSPLKRWTEAEVEKELLKLDVKDSLENKLIKIHLLVIIGH